MKMKYVVIALLLFSCSSVKHWKKVAADADVTPQKKAIIAPKVAAMFPPQYRYITGETILKTDTIVDVEALLEMNSIIDSLLFAGAPVVNVDSIKIEVAKLCKARIVTRTVHSVDTVYIPDAALIDAMQRELSTCSTVNASLQAQIKEAGEKLRAGRKWLWLFIALCAAVVGYGVIRIYSRLKL